MDIVALLKRVPGGLVRRYRRWSSDRITRANTAKLRLKRQSQSPADSPRVLVTGDLGKLGSIIADRLSSQFNVVGYDVRSGFGEDIANGSVLTNRMAGCKYVVHAAAIPHPHQGSMEDYFRVNVAGTLNVLRAATANQVSRVIYLSSTAYYGCDIKGRLLPLYFPIDESHPVASIHGLSDGQLDEYDQSKVMAEQLMAHHGTNRISEVVVLRLAPANLKSDTYPGDFDWRTCTDYRRGSYFATVHPESVGEAVLAALLAPGPFWYEAFNIVDKYAHETIDMRQFVAEEYPEVRIRRAMDNHDSVWDTGKAERILGFAPREDLK